MWLCQVCDQRHLDSQPLCPTCGGSRDQVGRPFDPDSVPPSPEELAQAEAFAVLKEESEIRRKRFEQRPTWPMQFFVRDLRAAYRHSRARGSLGAAWWVFGVLVTLSLLSLTAILAQVHSVPYWTWLAFWGLAVLVGQRLIRQDLHRQALERVRGAA